MVESSEVDKPARRSASQSVAKGLVAGVLAMATALGGGAFALATPPPPNPSDAAIANGRTEVNSDTAKVGQLTNQMSEAQSKLQQLSDSVELKREQANKAMVDMQSAQDSADQANAEARSAKAQADAANEEIERARKDLDEFAVGSYVQGSTVGSLAAFAGAQGPEEILQRAELLNAVSGSKLNALDEMQRARTDKANKDSAARAALDTAKQKQIEAGRAKQNADLAKQMAIQAQSGQQSEANRLQAQQASLQQQLNAAQAKVGGLEAQRANYNQWLAQKQADDEAAARQAVLGSGRRGGAPVVSAVTGSIAAVIARARSALGLPYAWGGGTSGGPSLGIHDGGVADIFGDYRKVGFDCSGLMIYAFAAAGVPLPHYSGYQYTAGRHVPLSAMQPGDMIFYGGPEGIHHVALYIGGGMMIEAPESGMVVRITPVRYGGIMPFATRVL